ncbi:hypothetical protein [Neobacillus jeddahensis]|uniref:hypothetical protein n=1 Tax=Neobacillus jeddahensis TaxID=1461580 RepID=UPI0005A6840A|nr:hypothetical protein [Neobacillus jeddahensis]
MYFIPTRVNLGSLKINSADHQDTVSIGPAILIGNHVNGKKNQGFGQQLADFSKIVVPIQFVLDNEIIDMPTMKRNGGVSFLSSMTLA